MTDRSGRSIRPPGRAVGHSRSVTDPRIQARRVSVARQLGRSRRRKLTAALVVIALGAGTLALVHSPILGARHVVVSGAPEVPASVVIRAAGLSNHPPLIDLDAAVIARRVERLPWVATAAVQIGWPSSVSIRLTERVPVATVRLPGGGYAVCDATGRILEDVAARPASLPVVSAARVGRPGSTLGGSAQALAAVAAAMPESMVPQAVELASSAEGTVLVLNGGLEAIIGSSDSLSQKFVSLATVLAHGGLSGVKVIDLRVAAAPVLIRQASGPIVAGNVGG
jgi:cell division protein FtsQ